MRDKVVYHEIDMLRDSRRPQLSPVALEIHVRAIDRSVRTPTPAFVADTTLDALAPGHVTTLAALELSLAGLWHRCKDGYVVSDFDLVDHLSESAFRRAAARWARAAGAKVARGWRAVNRDNFIPL